MKNPIKEFIRKKYEKENNQKVFRRYKELAGALGNSGEMINREKEDRARQWVKDQEKLLVKKESFWNDRNIQAAFITGFFTILAVIIGWIITSKNSQDTNSYKPPSLELSYYKDSENINDKNLYETNFVVSIHQPPGNFETGFKIINKVKDAECTNPEWRGSGTMTNGGIASSTYEYAVNCTSYRPILDTKDLFNLK